MDIYLRRGQIYYVDLGKNIGSEVNKTRPCLIIQNDIGNKYSPTTIVVPISHRDDENLEKGKDENKGKIKRLLPTQVMLRANMQEKGFKFLDGIIMTEQIRTIDKSRIKHLAGALLPNAMNSVDKALGVSVGLIGTKV